MVPVICSLEVSSVGDPFQRSTKTAIYYIAADLGHLGAGSFMPRWGITLHLEALMGTIGAALSSVFKVGKYNKSTPWEIRFHHEILVRRPTSSLARE